MTKPQLIEKLKKDIASLEIKHAASTGRAVYTIGNKIRYKKAQLELLTK